MAKISLNTLRHSYLKNPAGEEDYALKQIDTEWDDGLALALLGPSGCGKTTLLNIISGLLMPSDGRVCFDDQDVTDIATRERQIAQVFQFPVIYDTMTVYDNLAFPLRNRGVDESKVASRVQEVAKMLDLEEGLHRRAAGLTADGKQKISLGRGLVREDVHVMMFDEPLTVIDPHLKWALRSKLKELHQKLGTTMIYVTHDQTEALTFAEKVAVMHDGRIVQIGTPVELFDAPAHTFVGHFIGSPGMNFLPAAVDKEGVSFLGSQVDCANFSSKVAAHREQNSQIGVRPEFVHFSDEGIAVEIDRVDDLGRHKLVHARHDAHNLKLIVEEHVSIPAMSPKISFETSRTYLYQNGWLAGSSEAAL